MSEFYGRVQGSRGDATRCGSKASGISATAETWSSIVRADQHMSGESVSGHMAAVSVGGKYGGDCLYLAFDADTLYQVSDDPRVRDRLDKVRDAMRNADDCAQSVAREVARDRAAAE